MNLSTVVTKKGAQVDVNAKMHNSNALIFLSAVVRAGNI